MAFAVVRYLLVVSRGGLLAPAQIDAYADMMRQLVNKLPTPLQGVPRHQDISQGKYSISRSKLSKF
jgi:hypothetical protein